MVYEIDDELALELAEEYLESALSGEECRHRYHDEDLEEILGGSFIETSGDKEFGEASPLDDDTLREALPTAMSLDISALRKKPS
jgi:hypothetical protein